jgi:hypothetical protein
MSTICDDRGEAGDATSPWAERALLDRLNRLQVVLPALAHDMASARREAARLRVENGRLTRSLAELEDRYGTVAVSHSTTADA